MAYSRTQVSDQPLASLMRKRRVGTGGHTERNMSYSTDDSILAIGDVSIAATIAICNKFFNVYKYCPARALRVLCWMLLMHNTVHASHYFFREGHCKPVARTFSATGLVYCEFVSVVIAT